MKKKVFVETRVKVKQMTLPSESAVYQYVLHHPDCTSKDVAKYFGCGKDEINRSRPGYCGIYRIEGMMHNDFKHSVVASVLEPVAEPVAEPAKRKIPAKLKNGVVASVLEPVAEPVAEPAKRKIRATMKTREKHRCCVCLEEFEHDWQLTRSGCCTASLCRVCKTKVNGKCPTCRTPFPLMEAVPVEIVSLSEEQLQQVLQEVEHQLEEVQD